MKTIKEFAAHYVEERATGNSYVDERLKAAYLAGGRDAMKMAEEMICRHMAPGQQRAVRDIVKKIMG